MTKAKLWTDGGARGNPGPAAYGYVVESAGIVLEKCGNYLGHATNNQAEYEGLVAGLKYLTNNGFTDVDIFMDSLLIVNQVKGVYQVKNADLKKKKQEVTQFLALFEKWSINYVRREANAVADSLVNQALDRELQN